MQHAPRLALVALALALLAAPTRADDGERRLRILTWNVGTLLPWDLRLPDRAIPRVVSTIAAQRPDVVTLQEVRDAGQIARLRAGLAARGLRYEVASAVVDPAHPDGLAVVLHRGARRDAPRVTTSVAFVSPAVGLDGVTVVAVHAPTGAPDERRGYARDLIAWCAARPGAVVVAGDFNLGSHGGCGLAAVLPWLRRVDRATYALLGAAFASRTSVGPTTAYRLTFDHVMVRGGQVATQRALRGRRLFPMDHDPLVVDVTLAGRGLAGAVRSPGRTR
jgi:endonuclease/exonuclease/phosphatase family metal-dependent hydrolase